MSPIAVQWSKQISHFSDSNYETASVEAAKIGDGGGNLFLAIILKSSSMPMIALI